MKSNEKSKSGMLGHQGLLLSVALCGNSATDFIIKYIIVLSVWLV